ncbi:indole-3-glycerol phosphate synthase, chloroplastic-like protein, partial [Tanacetum coccineum]
MMMSSFSLNHTFKLRPSSSTPINYRPSLSFIIRLKAQQQSGTTDGTATDVSSSDSKVDIKEFKVRNSQEEISSTQGINIRRRPPTGPSTHYVGPFEFRLQNEGNTPRNILEEIVWNKDVEVAQMKSKKPLHTLNKAIKDGPPTKDFIGALKASYSRTGMPALIAEVKKASPSRGVIREDFDP